MKIDWSMEAIRLASLFKVEGPPQTFGHLRRAAVAGSSYGRGGTVEMMAQLQRQLDYNDGKLLAWAISPDGSWVAISDLPEYEQFDLECAVYEAATLAIGGDMFAVSEDQETLWQQVLNAQPA